MLQQIRIHTAWIKLDALLKFAGAAETGGQAKEMIQQGRVTLNGQVCLQRGKKLVAGDMVGVSGNTYEVVSA